MIKIITGFTISFPFPYNLCGHPGNKSIGWNVFCDQRMRGNDRLFSNVHTWKDNGTRVNLSIILYNHLLVFPYNMRRFGMGMGEYSHIFSNANIITNDYASL